MPGVKLLAYPRLNGMDDIVSRHRRRGSVVVWERFRRKCLHRFHAMSDDDRTELHRGNPFVSRAENRLPGFTHLGEAARWISPSAIRGVTAILRATNTSGTATDDCENYC